jgi:plastocyanin
MRTYVIVAVALLSTVGFLPIRAVGQEPPKKHPPQNVGGVSGAAGTGAVTGIVKFTGKKPDPRPINEVAGNAFCKQCYKDKLPVRDNIVIGTNGGDDTLENVLVYVSKGLEGKEFEAPKKPAVLDQVGCMYTPHVVAVMVGQTLEVRNSDTTLHNVMSMPRANPQFNFAMAVQGGTSNLVFRQPEFKMNLKCFMHPWMSGYVHVLEHPFFAVTGTDGTFKIEGLPPGEYELTVLHEAGALEPTPATATVTVAADEASDVEFVYQPREDGK